MIRFMAAGMFATALLSGTGRGDPGEVIWKPDSCKAKDVGKPNWALTSTVDQFKGYKRVRSPQGWLHKEEAYGDASLSLQQFTPKDGLPTYQVFAGYVANTWLFIREGESLLLIVDGETLSLSGPGSSNNRAALGGAGVREDAMYQVEPDLIRKLASASDVRVRLVGAHGHEDYSFDNKAFCVFRRFTREVLDSQ